MLAPISLDIPAGSVAEPVGHGIAVNVQLEMWIPPP